VAKKIYRRIGLMLLGASIGHFIQEFKMVQKVIFNLLLFCLLVWSCASHPDCPTAAEKFQVQIQHLTPHCQGKTNTCWAFSTLSFLESEIIRQTGQSVRLSPMWIVYHAYLEKAKNFWEKHGQARLYGGGLAHDVFWVIERYGIVRHEDFTGRPDPNDAFDHSEMDSVLKFSLEQWVQQPEMTPELIIEKTRRLLNQYLGAPPEVIEMAGEKISPREFAKKHLKIDLTQFVQVTSFLAFPVYEFGKLDLQDNWLGYDQYLNVPLPVFTDLLEAALTQHFSVAIDMDLTEKGYDKIRSCATLSPGWLATDSLNQATREALFLNASTTDDHLQHIVGFAPKLHGHGWFLIKDSLPSSYFSVSKGYIFMREDYLRMKVLSFLVHRDAIQSRLAKVHGFSLP
jgi:bleomycin hydrolase